MYAPQGQLYYELARQSIIYLHMPLNYCFDNLSEIAWLIQIFMLNNQIYLFEVYCSYESNLNFFYKHDIILLRDGTLLNNIQDYLFILNY